MADFWDVSVHFLPSYINYLSYLKRDNF